MSVFNLIEKRRSIKHFDPDHKMSEQEFEKLIKAATLAPTSFNIQHWRFVRVVDQQQRQKSRLLRGIKHKSVRHQN